MLPLPCSAVFAGGEFDDLSFPRNQIPTVGSNLRIYTFIRVFTLAIRYHAFHSLISAAANSSQFVGSQQVNAFVRSK